MAKKIDWLYERKGCTTCKKAMAFLDGAAVKIGEVVIANKQKYGPEDALELTKKVSKVVAMKGKKLEVLPLKTTDEETLLAHLIGPTGNLRAPTAIVGKTMYVGFNEEGYGEISG